MDAKLLGGVPLSAILQQMNFDDDDTSQTLSITSIAGERRTAIVTRLDWHPRIQPGGPGARHHRRSFRPPAATPTTRWT